jgi:hypothetical protein
MPDGFGLLNPVVAPFLEKIVREEHLGRDHPRKRREGKNWPAKEDEIHSEESADDTKEADNSKSSTHIDLRV